MSLKKVHDDQPKDFKFSDENLKKTEEILKKYPEKPIVVEVETMEQLRSVLSIKGITRVLCDNFSLIDLKEAVKIAQGLQELGYRILATSGTAEHLNKNDVTV